jgi:predicted regulator of Ras-like GTPase activity (Roadblock/LC7/MglB family)
MPTAASHPVAAKPGSVTSDKGAAVTTRLSRLEQILNDLAGRVPQARAAVVLSADGLRIAHHGSDSGTADHIAAACAGLRGMASAIAGALPCGDRHIRVIVVETDGGFCYLMAAGAGAYLALLTGAGTDARLVGECMRELSARIAAQLGQAVGPLPGAGQPGASAGLRAAADSR